MKKIIFWGFTVCRFGASRPCSATQREFHLCLPHFCKIFYGRRVITILYKIGQYYFCLWLFKTSLCFLGLTPVLQDQGIHYLGYWICLMDSYYFWMYTFLEMKNHIFHFSKNKKIQLSILLIILYYLQMLLSVIGDHHH